MQKLSDLTRRLHSSKKATWVELALLCLSWVALFGTMLRADDCMRDVGRAEDCLRTDSTAIKIAGTAATTVAVLVNGHTIIRTILTSQVQVNEGETPPEKFYTLQVRSVDATGATSTSFDLIKQDPLYIQAWIEASGEGASPADGGPIQIELQQGGQYIALSEGPPIANGRTVIVQASPQQPDDPPQQPAIVLVSAPLAGQPFSAPLTIELTRGEYELEFM